MMLALLLLLAAPDPAPRVVLMPVFECDARVANTRDLAARCSRDLQLAEVDLRALTSSLARAQTALRDRDHTINALVPCPACEPVEAPSLTPRLLLVLGGAAAGAAGGAAIGPALTTEEHGLTARSLGGLFGALTGGGLTLLLLSLM